MRGTDSRQCWLIADVNGRSSTCSTRTDILEPVHTMDVRSPFIPVLCHSVHYIYIIHIQTSITLIAADVAYWPTTPRMKWMWPSIALGGTNRGWICGFWLPYCCWGHAYSCDFVYEYKSWLYWFVVVLSVAFSVKKIVHFWMIYCVYFVSAVVVGAR